MVSNNHPGPAPAVLTTLLIVVLGGCQKNPTPGVTPPAATPQVLFEDVTGPSGVAFTHAAGTQFAMPEQMGAGIAVLDVDNDGRLDLYLVQNGPPENPLPNQLYRQLPDGTFENLSHASGADLRGRGMAAIAGDVNNDGLPDLVVTEYGATRLLLNVGQARFREVTRESGIANPRWGIPASFLDYDRDGRLDLVVGNYIDDDPTQACLDSRGARDFCAPQAFPSTAPRLWHNVTPAPGSIPVFEDVTEAAGLANATGAALGVLCADFSGDGWIDVYLADDGRPSRLLVNRRNGTFVDEAAIRGLAYNGMGRTAANMGVACGDFDLDGRLDLFVTHLTEEFHSLYLQDQPGLFRDAIAQSGLLAQGWRGTGFGAVAADFDLDGLTDLAFVNGLIRRMNPAQSPALPGVHPFWTTYAQRPQLFLATRPGIFHDASESQPALTAMAFPGRSLAVGDLDNDGRPDLVLAGVGSPARILRNVARQTGAWITIRAIEPDLGGRDAIGAEIRVQTSSRTLPGIVQPASSYASSNDPRVHFGLGTDTNLLGVTVTWPDGGREHFGPVALRRQTTLRHGDGRPDNPNP